MRLFLIVISTCFLMSSCGLFQGGQGQGGKSPDDIVLGSDPKKVDTIQWKDETGIPEDPISSEKTGMKDIEGTEDSEFKDRYTVANIIPFEISRMNLDVENTDEIRNVKYLHYYAGMQLALDQLEQEDVVIELNTWDVKDNSKDLDQVLLSKMSRLTDVIFGPVKKDHLITLAEFGQENSIPVISPWYSSQSIADKNPYYIQLTPFLTEHYRAITQHALSHFDPSQIYLLGRQGSKDASRFRYFQEEAYNLTGEQNVLNEYVFDVDSLTFEYEIIRKIVQKQFDSEGKKNATVFILPNYSPRESQYIYDVIRRINVERGDNEVLVYGMPVLYSMDKMTYDYYNNLNMRIALSRFPQKSNYDVKAFGAKFFNEYNSFPLDEAYEGYDNMLFIGRMLKKYGTRFFEKLDQDENEYLTTKFNIKPITEVVDEKEEIDYLENKNLRIIQLINDEFVIVE